MGWRTVIISNSAKLDLSAGCLTVRQQETKRIYLEDISVIIIESTAVSLTAALIAEISKKKIKLIFCDEKHLPCSEVVSYYGAHDTSRKVLSQLEWDRSLKSIVWAEIVKEKIRNQSRVLLQNGLYSPSDLLNSYAEQVQPGDTTNREGHAAKVYFNALFGTGFSRDNEDGINAALNYGYSMILASVAREVVANGYITQVGLFHKNVFNFFNLASDLMEPIRPFVDSVVLSMRPVSFGTEEKRQLQTMLHSRAIVCGRRETLLNAISVYCRSVFSALEQGEMDRLRFIRFEF